MQLSGNLAKMKTTLDSENLAHYTLSLNNENISINHFLGKHIKLNFTGVINCIVCGKTTKKSFGQGFCYPCFIKSPENSECIIHPELCKGHLGEGRDLNWEIENHVKPHYVYLASGYQVKIGITRATQVPTRWIDQGASSAIIIAETPNRFLSGIIEVELKKNYSDKTDYRKMLKNEMGDFNLLEEKEKALSFLPDELKQHQYLPNDIFQIKYPNLYFPEKIQAVSFEKKNFFEGKLIAIKGQYLINDLNEAINIRNQSGYFINFECYE